MDKTFGQKLVRADFNASNDDKVANMKEAFASLIDQVNDIRNAAWNSESPTSDENQERGRAASIAITNLETAAMYAVKALTV